MRSIVLYLAVAGAVATLLGCAPCEECGSLKRQNEITFFFLNNKIVPDYDYYYSGRYQWPSAIMAIEPSYSIKSNFWKPVGLEGEELSEWLKTTTIWKQSNRTRLNGAEILDPKGSRVGIFYSKFDNLITKFEANNVIQVYPPSYRAGGNARDSTSDRD
ncbi:MAG: hypothetical protein KJO60_09955 [Desulfofustis sp.]|nr:hypothetical protein [Desulfofustis sp.]MBT8354837.1 hypothetical protein [Desulfofustis sp.]NNF47551.1 hypothetical protein [Desulfofustis sp.]NNK58113.1 hypothetical protein [Desulfofustis sp.]